MSGQFDKSYQITEIGPLQLWRHAVQLLTFVFLNGKLFGLASTSIIVPYLWSTGAPSSTVYGAFDALEYTISRGIFPLLVLGVIYITAVTVGRVFCGWACPMGMVQDLLSYLPMQKEKLSVSTHNQLRDVKWVVLGVSLLVSALVGYNRSTVSIDTQTIGPVWESPFTVLSPHSTLFAYLPWMLIWKPNVLAESGSVGWLKMICLIATLVPSMYVPRFFCRYICPMGTLLQPLSSYKFLRIHKSSKLAREELNQVLKDVCPMEVQVLEEDAKFINDPNCIHCGKCLTEFPTQLSQRIG